MRSKLFYVFVLCLVPIKATAQEIDPDTVIYNGISGTYTLSERWKLFDQVVKQRIFIRMKLNSLRLLHNSTKQKRTY